MKEYQETSPIRRVAATNLPTRWGVFQAAGFERPRKGRHSPETAIVLVLGEPSQEVPLVRIQSQCITGDVLRSLRCDCGEQLELAMQAIAAEGCGLLIYEQQEGRGIGLMAKLQAYALQDQGLDIVGADRATGAIQGRRGGINMRANVVTQADGKIRVEFNAGGALGEDPGLPERVSRAYDARLGR